MNGTVATEERATVRGGRESLGEALGEPLGEALIIGLIGQGIGRSRSPRMHETEGARHGLRLVYRLLDTDRMGAPRPSFAEALRAAEIAGFAGVNVTYPYKREALEHLERLDPSAEAVGAVNTIVLRDGARVGHNTDYWGFAENLRRGLGGAPLGSVLLLGAGGAGGAVAAALLDSGVERLMIHDIDASSAEALADRLAGRTSVVRVEVAANLSRAASQADGIVNATPVGMASLPGSPLPTPLLCERHWVADIIYFPLETQLLWAARKKGCRTLSGEGMAVFQAVRAFELFTGRAADAGCMKRAFDSFSD